MVNRGYICSCMSENEPTNIAGGAIFLVYNLPEDLTATWCWYVYIQVGYFHLEMPGGNACRKACLEHIGYLSSSETFYIICFKRSGHMKIYEA